MYIDTKPTDKQITKITYMIESGAAYSETLKTFWESQPTHDTKHTDERCNYRRAILFETLRDKIKSRNYASLIISYLYDNKTKELISSFKKLNLTI